MLIGLCREDNEADIEYMVRKLLNLRLFDNAQSEKRWDKSVKELGLDILCVSQVGGEWVIRWNGRADLIMWEG